MLKERGAMMADIKLHLSHAQDLMKNNADKHRRDLTFDVGVHWTFSSYVPIDRQV